MGEALENNESVTASQLPGEELEVGKMPGHWVLARLGKRVLRPGGLEMTRQLLASLEIAKSDHVIEFAPGLGLTARMALAARPASFTAIERDDAAANLVEKLLRGPGQLCVRASAERTGLDAEVATVVYGEAILTMQPLETKRRIAREAYRLLRVGGRYALHEICLVPEDIGDAKIRQIEGDLGRALRVGARPLRRSEWTELLEAEGFKVQQVFTGSFRLLEPIRMVQDEGLYGALRFALKLIADQPARQRVLMMRRTIRSHANHMEAIMLMAVKQ